jgi:hypothetical protein
MKNNEEVFPLKKHFAYGFLTLSLCAVVLVNDFHANPLSPNQHALKSDGPTMPEQPEVPLVLKSDGPSMPELPEVPFA